MKRKGFTLIELLAVIVILAIIAFIAVPMILGVVERARKSAAESSAAGYLDAVEKQMMVNELDEDTTNDIPDGTITVATLNSTYKVKGKGTKPEDDGTVIIENKKIVSATLSVNGYDITCTSEKCSVQGSSKSKGITNIVLSEDATIEKGDSHTFTATIEPSDADISSIKWCSSNTIISGANLQGRCKTGEYEITACYGNTSCEITGANAGDATITVRTNNSLNASSNVTIYEVQPLVPTMTSNTTPSGECFASTECNHPSWANDKNKIYNAFDKDKSTYWWMDDCYLETEGIKYNNYIGYDFVNAIKVSGLELTMDSYASPITSTYFILEGSNDKTNWSAIGDRFIIDGFTSEASHTYLDYTFHFNNSNSYRYYRIRFPEQIAFGGNNFVLVAELQFLGK